MNTISLNRNMNVAFKQVQRLPVLTPAMMPGEGAPSPVRPTCLARPMPTLPQTHAATPTAPASQLPRPGANQCTGERALFAVLGLSALFSVVQALATVIASSPDAPQFTAWVAQWFA